MNKLLVAGGVAALLMAAVYGLIQYGRTLERADNVQATLELQTSLFDLGLLIQKQEGAIADKTRITIETEQGRIDAISVNEHQSEKIQTLERLLRKASKAADQAGSAEDSNADFYRVVRVDVINRVWDQARNNGELPASNAASVLQTRLSAVSGDVIAGTIKDAISKYNQCGIKYNKLWRRCDTIIEAKN